MLASPKTSASNQEWLANDYIGNEKRLLFVSIGVNDNPVISFNRCGVSILTGRCMPLSRKSKLDAQLKRADERKADKNTRNRSRPKREKESAFIASKKRNKWRLLTRLQQDFELPLADCKWAEQVYSGCGIPNAIWQLCQGVWGAQWQGRNGDDGLSFYLYRWHTPAYALELRERGVQQKHLSKQNKERQKKGQTWMRGDGCRGNMPGDGWPLH